MILNWAKVMNMMKFNSLIPKLTVSDINKTKEFYIDILGFKIEFERPEDKFVFLSLGDAQMMFEEYHEDGWNVAELEYPYGRGINFEIGVSDIELLYDKVLKAGIKPYRDLKTNVYVVDEKETKQTEFLMMDPDGYLLRFVDE